MFNVGDLVYAHHTDTSGICIHGDEFMFIFVSRFKGRKYETVNESLNSVDLSSDRMKKGKGGCEALKKVRIYKILILFLELEAM